MKLFSKHASATAFVLLSLAACGLTELPLQSSCTQLCVEAESARLYGLFELSSKLGASGQQVIRSPQPNETTISDRMQAPDITQRFELSFTATAGNYYVKTFVAAPDDASDSFYVQVNDDPYFVYSFNDVAGKQNYPELQEDFLRDGLADPKLIRLKEGRNSLTFYLRETGAELDKLEFIKLP